MAIIQTVCSLWHNLFFAFIGIIGISLVVAFHEFGHFLFCKIFNIKTPSFSIGFGPRLISKKIGETEFAISAIPLGGYVEIAGAAEVGQGEQKDAYSKDDRSFTSKPWYQKFLVMIAGIAFNMIFAYFAITLIFMTGMPKTLFMYPHNTDPVIAEVMKDSPAEKAGLLAEDTILSIDGRLLTTDNAASLVEEILKNPNKTVQLAIARNNQEQTIPLTIAERDFLGEKLGTAGFKLQVHALPSYSFIESIKAGFALTNKLIMGTFAGLRYTFGSGDTSKVQGPVQLIAGTMQGAQEGFKTFLLFLAIISISLGVLNLLPLPILDGGQIVFYTIEAIVRRPIPDRVREYIHIACWLFVLGLTLLLSYRDIKELVKSYFAKPAQTSAVVEKTEKK